MSQYSIFAKLGIDMKDFDAGVDKFQKQMKAMAREMGAVDREWSGLTRVGEQLSGIGMSLTKNLTVPLAAVAAASLKAGIDFESAFAGVRKTVDASEEDLKKLERGIRDMAMEIPASAEAIAGVAEAAGQLGIKTENILSFTRTMIDLGEATNLTADQAATLLARFANVTGLPQDEFDRIGSTIVALGNNFATTEAEIAEMAQRLAAAGSIAGVTAPEIMGFSAALTSVGINAEAGGTAFSKLFTEIFAATQSGGEKLSQFARVAGMSAEQFRESYEQNATGAIVKFVEGLGNINKSGGNVIAVLDEMGITEIRMRNALLSSAEAGDLLADAIGTANDAFEDNNALNKEAAERYKTTAAQLSILWNRVKELGYQIAQILMPAFKAILEVVGSVVDWFSQLDEGTKRTIVTIGLAAAAIGPLVLAVGKFITVGATIITTLGKLKVAFAAIGGPVTLAVAAIAGAAYLIYDNWEGISDWFEDMWHKVYMTHALMAQKIVDVLAGMFSWIPGAETMFAALKHGISEAIDAEEVRRRAQLVERSIEGAVATTGSLEAAAQSASDSIEDVGTSGTEAGNAIVAGMEGAISGVKSLMDQVSEIMQEYQKEWDLSEREFRFILKLNDIDFVNDKIRDTEAALRSLARDTTISIDDENVVNLQKRLQNLRGELAELEAQAKVTKLFESDTFDEISRSVMVTEGAFSKLSLQIGEARSESLSAESSLNALADVLESNMAASQLVDDQLAEFALTLADTSNNVAIYEDAIYGLSLTSEQGASHLEILAGKIDLTREYLADSISVYGEASAEADFYRQRLEELEREQASFGNTMLRIGEKYFPSLIKAFDFGKAAVESFKSAFKGDNGKPMLENLGEGFHNVAGAIASTKSMMNEFGNAAGLILGGLDLLVPGLGTAITGLSAVFEQLGIDVSGALKSISDAISKLTGGGGGASATEIINSMLTGIGNTGQLNTALGSTIFSADTLKDMFAGSKSFEDFIQKLVDYAAKFGENFSFDQIAGAFSAQQISKIKNVGFPGLYDPETGQTAQVSPELQAQIMARLAELQASDTGLTAQEILDILIAQFGKTPLKTLGIAQMLGLPPLAKGGLAFGPTLALVGDNPSASIDPEVISPLSKLKGIMVGAVRDAAFPILSAGTAGAGMGANIVNNISVYLDGERIQEFTTRGVVDTLRRAGIA